MQNTDPLEFEFNILKQHLEELHVLNVSENAPGNPEIYKLLESASRIQQSDFLLSAEENVETCNTINRCIGSINKIINEKSDCKNLSSIFLNQNSKVHHIKEIINRDSNQENKDFLANIIKGCEILGNTLHKFQKTNCVSQNECVTDIYKAAYSIANNLTKMLKEDEKLKSFFNHYSLRIDSMLRCPEEKSHIDSFAKRQKTNYTNMVKKAKISHSTSL